MRLLAEQPLDAFGEAPDERHADGGKDDRAEGFLTGDVEPVELPRQEVRVAERGDHALDEQLGRPRAEDHESPEDRGVHGAGDRVAEDLGLEDADAEEVPHAGRYVAPTEVVEAADAQIPDQPLDVRGEEPDREDEYCEENGVRRVHSVHPEALACFTAAVRTGRISSTSPTMP